jgi:hypothetical protein
MLVLGERVKYKIPSGNQRVLRVVHSLYMKIRTVWPQHPGLGHQASLFPMEWQTMTAVMLKLQRELANDTIVNARTLCQCD